MAVEDLENNPQKPEEKCEFSRQEESSIYCSENKIDCEYLIKTVKFTPESESKNYCLCSKGNIWLKNGGSL